MAVAIIERPYDFCFSENEIRYVLSVSDAAAPGCAVEFQLFYGKADILVNSTKLITFQLTPDDDGKIYCHVGDYLKSILRHQLPDLGGSLVQPVEDQTRYFLLKYREINTADSSAGFKTDLHLKVIIMGGVEKMKFKRNNFFVTYLKASKAFLTWQKNTYVYLNQPHYLTFLLAPYKADFIVNVKTVFTDNSIDTSKTRAITANLNVLFRINATAKAWDLQLINPAKSIYYYEISVKDVDGNYLANPHRFYIEYNPVKEYWDLNYYNSLSGMDVVRVTGETAISVDVPGEQQEHIIYRDEYNTDKPQHQYSSTNMLKTDNYKGDAGYLNFTGEQEALIELLLSKGIYDIVDGRWIKCINLKKSQDVRLTTDKKWNFPIEWSYGYDDRVFTPKGIMLGAGTVDVVAGPVCTPVQIPAGITLPDGIVGVPYSYYFDLLGDAPFVLITSAKPDWMTIAVAGNRVTFSGTPDVAATDIHVTFNVTNCSGGGNANFDDVIDVTAVAVPGAGSSSMVILAAPMLSMFQETNRTSYDINVSILSPTGITSQSNIRVTGVIFENLNPSNSYSFDLPIVAGSSFVQADYILNVPLGAGVGVTINSIFPTNVTGSDGVVYNVVH